MELDQAGGLRKLETFGVAVVDRRDVGCGSDEEHRWRLVWSRSNLGKDGGSGETWIGWKFLILKAALTLPPHRGRSPGKFLSA